MVWYQDPGVWSALGSLGAVMIAVLALWISSRAQSAQKKRELRAELRGLLERLIEIREGHSSLGKENDEVVRAAAGVWLVTKRAFYLESAKAIAKQLDTEVSPSELYVIGLETGWDGDVREARWWLERATREADALSHTRRAELFRYLASTYFSDLPELRDVALGRRYYERALDALAGRDDTYSTYCRALLHQSVAASEFAIGNVTGSADHLRQATDGWATIPPRVGMAWASDLRALAYAWGVLGQAWFRDAADPDAIQRGRAAFAQALELVDRLTTRFGVVGSYPTEARGLLLQWHGQQELLISSGTRGTELIDLAERAFRSLPEDFPSRALLLAEIAQIRTHALDAQPAAPAAVPTTMEPPGIRTAVPAEQAAAG